MGLLGSLGGITAILVFVTGGLFKTFANFSVDNSMISELYTLPLETTPNIPTPIKSTSINDEGSNTTLIQGNVLPDQSIILGRRPFKYNLWMAIFDYFKNNCCSCFYKCCCKQSKMNIKFKIAQ